MTDRDVVERFWRIVGCGNVYRIVPCATSPSRKIQWRWEVGNRRDSRALTTTLLPYLGERRAAKAREVIAAASVTDGRSTGITKKHPHLMRPV